MRRQIAIHLLVLCMTGCIDPMPVGSIESEPALVVDGMITDQPGPYTIRLSMSTGLAEDIPPQMVGGASMWILDKAGNTFKLVEKEPGVYVTDPSELRGEIGKAYSLRFMLQDGSEYRSSEEILAPAGVIDSVYAVYYENVINQTDLSLPQDAITFYVSGRSDPVNSDGLLRWRSSGIYQILTYPEERTRIIDETRVPDPLPCSGHINLDGRLVKVDTCSCCNCWVFEYARQAVVSPARVYNANEFHNVAVAQVPVDGWRFSHKYYFELEQLSVSPDVYEFWKRVRAQQQGARNLFQPNAIKVKGNLRCVSDPDIEVFGIFAASSITRTTMDVTRAELSRVLPQPERIAADCRDVLDNATNVKPPFW